MRFRRVPGQIANKHLAGKNIVLNADSAGAYKLRLPEVCDSVAV